MDSRHAGRERIAVGHGVANAAAERVHHVFFRMAIGREVDPLAAAALAAVVSERVLQIECTAGGSSGCRCPAAARWCRARPAPGAAATGR